MPLKINPKPWSGNYHCVIINNIDLCSIKYSLRAFVQPSRENDNPHLDIGLIYKQEVKYDVNIAKGYNKVLHDFFSHLPSFHHGSLTFLLQAEWLSTPSSVFSTQV